MIEIRNRRYEDRVAVERLRPHPLNPRRGDLAAIAESIAENGFYGAVVAQESTGHILAGNHRYLAALQRGAPHLPVIWLDVDDDQARRILLADNRTSDLAGYDDPALARLLQDLQATPRKLAGTGYDDAAVKEILDRIAEEAGPKRGLTDDDAAPAPPPTPRTAPGQAYRLGEHRLLCGDATAAEDLLRLMAGERADLVFTDPPYNVDYEGYTPEGLTIRNDALPGPEYQAFLEKAFRGLARVAKPEASLYVCHASAWQREVQNALEAAGWAARQQIIWGKERMPWGMGRYKFQHEPMFYAHVAGQVDAWYGDRTQTTLWQAKQPHWSREHPTMKPVELVEVALRNSSRRGDLVADPFGGAGSTLIACEKLGRRARLLEIEPRYCDVVVRRWEEWAGKKAEPAD